MTDKDKPDLHICKCMQCEDEIVVPIDYWTNICDHCRNNDMDCHNPDCDGGLMVVASSHDTIAFCAYNCSVPEGTTMISMEDMNPMEDLPTKLALDELEEELKKKED
jgi:hypothetical protein